MSQRDEKKGTEHLRELSSFYKKHIMNKEAKPDFDQTEAARKRALLSLLLSGEIAPSEFKERVKEKGISTLVLTLKEQWQKDMEFWGRDSRSHVLGSDYTFQEVFERFEDFEQQIADFNKQGVARSPIFDFTGDQEAIIIKISNREIAEDERKEIWVAYCERWGEI